MLYFFKLFPQTYSTATFFCSVANLQSNLPKKKFVNKLVNSTYVLPRIFIPPKKNYRAKRNFAALPCSELNTKTVGVGITSLTRHLCHMFYNVAHTIIAEHINRKKNLAASCIQSSWRLYHFITENVDTTERLDWFKAQKLRMLQHKQANAVRRWRVVRRSWSRGTRIELQI